MQYYFILRALIFTVNFNKHGFFISDYMKELESSEGMWDSSPKILLSYTHSKYVGKMSPQSDYFSTYNNCQWGPDALQKKKFLYVLLSSTKI